MRLLIDGDACPDRQKVIELALHYGVEVLLFIDFAHVIEDERIQIIMCEVGKDSVDQMILSYLHSDGNVSPCLPWLFPRPRDAECR